jgi:hypothetical protein
VGKIVRALRWVSAAHTRSIHQPIHAPMSLSSALRSPAILFSAAGLALAGAARAQTIFVADPNGTNGVRSYNINGTLLNSSLVSGDGFQGLALSGTTLYIADASSGAASIRKATLDSTGAVVSTGTLAFGDGITGLTSPFGLTATGTHLYAANFNSGNVFKYDFSGTQVNTLSTSNSNSGISPAPYGVAISGDTLFVSQATTGTGANTIKGYSLTTLSSTPTMTLTTNLSNPHGLAISGNTLYVANGGSGVANGTIETFNATTGASTGTLVSSLGMPQGITVYGSSLFVTGGDGTVKGFNRSDGSALAGFTTITGLSSPHGIVIGEMSAIPEPSTYAAIAGAAMLGLAVWQRRRKSAATLAA